MGEAKRRKLAGTYPNPDDPIEAARRFWTGRGKVSADDFRVPEGTIALTFDVAGADPSSLVIAADKLTHTLAVVERLIGGQSYEKLVCYIGSEFVRARKSGSDAAFDWMGPAALWTAFNHPEAGDQLRGAVSDELRRDGKAHITWHLGPDGLAIALAGTFVDMDGAGRSAPRDSVTVIAHGSDTAPLH